MIKKSPALTVVLVVWVCAAFGTEDVTVPVGSYTCKHLKYAHGGGGDTMQWWLSDKVPGEIVKAVFTRKDAPKNGEKTRTTVLAATGDDATSRLGSF